MAGRTYKLRVLESFGQLVDGVPISPDKGDIIVRGRGEAKRLERAGLVEPIYTPEERLVRAAKDLGVGLVTNRAHVISAAQEYGVAVKDTRPPKPPQDEAPATPPEAPADPPSEGDVPKG